MESAVFFLNSNQGWLDIFLDLNENTYGTLCQLNNTSQILKPMLKHQQ